MPFAEYAEPGGQFRRTSTVPQKPRVARLYEQIGRSLGTAYSLGYVPSNTACDGYFRKIEVKVRNAGLRLTQSRTGYYALPSAK